MLSKNDIINKLQANKSRLQNAGLRHLYLFGSVARGDNSALSDMDFAGDFSPKALEDHLSHLIVVHEIQEALGTDNFDFANQATLKAHVKPGFEKDKVQIF